jgi:hypothetical protein
VHAVGVFGDAHGVEPTHPAVARVEPELELAPGEGDELGVLRGLDGDAQVAAEGGHRGEGLGAHAVVGFEEVRLERGAALDVLVDGGRGAAGRGGGHLLLDEQREVAP